MGTNMRNLNLQEVHSHVLNKQILYPTDIKTREFTGVEEMRASVDRLTHTKSLSTMATSSKRSLDK